MLQEKTMSDSIYTLYSPTLKRIQLTAWRASQLDGFCDGDGCVRIFSVLQGCGDIAHDDITEHFSEGDAFIFDNGKKFLISNTDNAEIFIMKFNLSDFIDVDYKAYQKETVTKFLSFIEASGERMRGIHINSRKIQDAMYMIEKEFECEGAVAHYVIKSYVVLIISLIMQYFLSDLDDGKVNRNPHYKSIKETIIYINDNLAEKLTLDELARVANLGKTSYSTAFKDVTGMTVWEYILNARIEFAANYLSEKREDLNITEIAMMSGFNDVAHFAKVFKRIKGDTPKEFKKNSQNPCF